MGTLVNYKLYWIWVIYYPVVNGRSDSERLGYPYSQEKMASKLELWIEFPNHMTVHPKLENPQVFRFVCT